MLLREGVFEVSLERLESNQKKQGAMGADCIRSFKDFHSIEGAAFLALRGVQHTPQQPPSSAGLERAIGWLKTFAPKCQKKDL